MVQYSFTSTETRKLVRTDSPGWPPRLSHSSWTMSYWLSILSHEKSKFIPPSPAPHTWVHISTFLSSWRKLQLTSTVPNLTNDWWVMWTIRLSKNQQLPYTVVFFSTDWQDYDTDSHFSQISRGTGTRDYTDYFKKTQISTHLTPSLTKRQSK